MSKLIDNLKDYGVNVELTMARFVDDESLFEHCLSMFFEGKEFAQLESALSAKDWVSAFDAAHTIKGLSGNLGLTPLYDKVCALVEPLRHNETSNVDALYADVSEEMKKVEAIWKDSIE